MPFLIDNIEITNERVFSDRILKVLPTSSFQNDLNIIDIFVSSASSSVLNSMTTSTSFDNNHDNHDNINRTTNKIMSIAEITIAMKDNNDLSLIIYKQRVYNIKLWLPKHPGGDLVITHMIGEDATNQILAFHSNLKHIERILDKYLYADLMNDDDSDKDDDVDDNDNNNDNKNYLSYDDNDIQTKNLINNKTKTQRNHDNNIDNSNHHRLANSFDSLKDTVNRLGLMETSYLFYYLKGLQYLIQFIISIFICIYIPSSIYHCNSIIGGISIGMVS